MAGCVGCRDARSPVGDRGNPFQTHDGRFGLDLGYRDIDGRRDDLGEISNHLMGHVSQSAQQISPQSLASLRPLGMLLGSQTRRLSETSHQVNRQCAWAHSAFLATSYH